VAKTVFFSFVDTGVEETSIPSGKHRTRRYSPEDISERAVIRFRASPVSAPRNETPVILRNRFICGPTRRGVYRETKLSETFRVFRLSTTIRRSFGLSPFHELFARFRSKQITNRTIAAKTIIVLIRRNDAATRNSISLNEPRLNNLR